MGIMAIITEKIRENADACKDYVERVLRDADKDGVMMNELQGLLKTIVNVAPGRKDFEKVYGEKPYDYFAKKLENFK